MEVTKTQLVAQIAEKARLMRKHAVDMSFLAGPSGAHLSPGLSMMEIMATLYFGVLRYDPKTPDWPERDRFILSKGHGVLGFYTALAEAGYFPLEVLDTFETDDCVLPGHPCMNLSIGIEASTGSLGHGLSLGVGLALAARMDRRASDTYVLVGDGECNEGMIWEAIMAASHYRLDNLVAVVDRNRLQSDGFCAEIMQMDPLAEKWQSFGWGVREVDGHDIEELLDAFHRKSRPKGKPYVVIANTVKGKGISFAEDNVAWHHNRLSQAETEKALGELGFGAHKGDR